MFTKQRSLALITTLFLVLSITPISAVETSSIFHTPNMVPQPGEIEYNPKIGPKPDEIEKPKGIVPTCIDLEGFYKDTKVTHGSGTTTKVITVTATAVGAVAGTLAVAATVATWGAAAAPASALVSAVVGAIGGAAGGFAGTLTYGILNKEITMKYPDHFLKILITSLNLKISPN